MRKYKRVIILANLICAILFFSYLTVVLAAPKAQLLDRFIYLPIVIKQEPSTPTRTSTTTATASLTATPSSTQKPNSTPSATPGMSYPLFRTTVIQSYGAGYGIGEGDFNNDGRLDVAMTTSNRLLVFLQKTDGLLASPVLYQGGSRGSSIGVGDLNNDGLADIAVANPDGHNTLDVYLQQSNGSLANRATYSTDIGPDAIAVGDINGDGLSDIVVSHWSAPNIGVFLQNASGSLDPMLTYASYQAGYDDIAIGDVNGDGRNDVVKMNGQGAYSNLSVYLQNSSGTLAPAVDYSLTGCSLFCAGHGIKIGDVTGDGKADVVMSYGGNTSWAKMAVFAQGNDGSLQAAVSYSANDSPNPVALADVNRDGRLDVIVAHEGWASLSIYLQRANGTLQPYFSYSIPQGSYLPQGLVAGDLDSDGAPDIAIADYSNSLVVMYQAYHFIPTATFTPSKTATITPTFTPTPINSHTPTSTRTPTNMPALAIVVTNANDTGPGSLRAAIADILPNGTITFAPSLAGQTITLASTLSASKNMTIDGSSLSSRFEISGNSAVRIFTLGSFGGSVTLRSLVLKNGYSAGSGNNGAALTSSGGQITIDNVSFIGNHAYDGGAIYLALYNSNLIITHSEFSSNTAQNFGGAIFVQYSSLVLSNCTLTNNTAASNGGAVMSPQGGPHTIENNTFVGNSAVRGGAISFPSVDHSAVIRGNLFSGNTASGTGGAMVSDTYSPYSVIYENNTFYANQANTGGAVGITDSATLRNNTFSDNRATKTGGNAGASIFLNAPFNVTLTNNILANNTAGGECSVGGTGVKTYAGMNNLVEDGSVPCSSLAGTIIADPQLGPLADNGGSTLTMALLPGSPAIDAGDDANCPATDQRGVTRPQGAHCDIGAFEY